MINIEQEIALLEKEITKIRRTLHKKPELGLLEYETSKLVKEKLAEYKIEYYESDEHTGVVAFLKGELDESIAFRADMDGLEVKEENETSYKSEYVGKMHACGHDGHTAALLGFAKYLSTKQGELKKNIVLIFQPAEEGPGGAEILVKEGILEKFKVEKMIGFHIFPNIEQGKIGCKKGPIMARTAEINIKIQGKSGHGAMPHTAVDAIVIEAHLMVALQTIVSRSVNPLESSVITFGKIYGGEVRNVIAGEVVIEGTMRAFDDETFEIMKTKIHEIALGFEKAYDCSIDVYFNDMYPAVNNDGELVEYLKKAVGLENYIEMNPLMLAEDFAYYQRVVPGVFFMLGSKNEKEGYIYPLHNGRFDFDEKILVSAVQVYANLLKEYKIFK